MSKFAALGTYLANLADESAREPYTHLSWELEKVVSDAKKTPVAVSTSYSNGQTRCSANESGLRQNREAMNRSDELAPDQGAVVMPPE